MRFFIPGNVPSSKNSKVWTGKFLINSKTTRAYIKESEDYWLTYTEEFRLIFDSLPKPVHVSFEFIRASRHKFDYANPLNTVQDLMVKYGWLPDDNADEILPVLVPYSYNKEKAGVYIEILS